MPVKRTDPDYQAQAILSKRDHSVFELQTKMKHKGFTTNQVNTAVAKLKKLKLLDDRSFARKYTEEILRFKAVGPRLVIHKLRQKGISQALINEAIDLTFANGYELKLAKQAAQKWQQQHPQHQRDRQRLTRFLVSRGFSAVAGECALQSVDEWQTD